MWAKYETLDATHLRMNLLRGAAIAVKAKLSSGAGTRTPESFIEAL